jgi:glutathione synthase/RimK-type ligase-like ATP-grasp enzyme
MLKHNNIDFIELHIDDHDFWENVKRVDLFLFRYAHVDDHHQLVSTILPVIENYLKIKCFPNLHTCWHFDDKIKEYYLLRSLGYPMIESWIFWEKEHALEWAERAVYPVVFKLKKGAGSRNVILIDTKTEAVKIINRMFGKGILSSHGIPHKGKVKYKNLENYIRHKTDQYFLNKIRGIKPTIWQNEKNYVLFQRFLPNNTFDTRVTVTGKRAYAIRRFVRKDDFRASGSGNWDMDRNNIDLRCVEMGLKISKELKFQSMAYDFLFDEKGEPQICEISWTFPDDPESGYWDENLNWHDFQFIPPFFHLKDALNLEDFKHPKI